MATQSTVKFSKDKETGGASMGTGTMTADTITWTGETMMMGQRMKVRDTIDQDRAQDGQPQVRG